MEIRPFRIDIPEPEVIELRRRLASTRWPDAVEGAGWAYGVDDEYLRGLTASWADFDWRAEERKLNGFPHFVANVDDEQIHFIHVRSGAAGALPLILTNGFPSSFVEWLGVIDLLARPAGDGSGAQAGFDVVIPSIPGYGFSEIPRRPGMTPRRVASLWAGLMEGLGYERFGAAGCDWGNSVCSFLGLDYPSRTAGIHIGAMSLSHAERAGQRTPAMETYARARKLWHSRETGYVEIQSTKPQTLAYGLTDSPAGLAAWIGEKFRAWSDHDGDPEKAIPREVLLSNISVYWFTRTIYSAMRLYYENRRAPYFLPAGQRIEVPSAFFVEPSGARRGRTIDPDQMTPRPGQAPRERAETAYNVRRWTEPPIGGHFPAIETPALWVADVRAFFAGLRG